MSTQTASDLHTLVCEPHTRALAELADGPGDRLAAVGWCCTHLAASDSVLYPVVRRRVQDGARRVRTARADDQLLQQALCRLDRRLTGASHLDEVPVTVIVQEVRIALRVHAATEEEMLERLIPELEAEEAQQLAQRMAAATAAAPTRPHPHNRHTALSPLIARVDAAVDRVRDVMDNRVVPSGRRPRPALPPSRWSCYAMGTPYPPEPPERP